MSTHDKTLLTKQIILWDPVIKFCIGGKSFLEFSQCNAKQRVQMHNLLTVALGH